MSVESYCLPDLENELDLHLHIKQLANDIFMEKHAWQNRGGTGWRVDLICEGRCDSETTSTELNAHLRSPSIRGHFLLSEELPLASIRSSWLQSETGRRDTRKRGLSEPRGSCLAWLPDTLTPQSHLPHIATWSVSSSYENA